MIIWRDRKKMFIFVYDFTKQNMKNLILLFAIWGITNTISAQEMIIGSDEFYQLNSWNADTIFGFTGSGSGSFYYDLDQDGEHDILFYINYYLGGSGEHYEISTEPLGNFQIISLLDFKYIKNSTTSKSWRINTSLSSASAAEPFYLGDTVQYNSHYSQATTHLAYMNRSYFEPPNFIYYYIDLFQKNPVFIVLKKVAENQDYFYFLQISLGSNNSVHLTNIYTTDYSIGNIDQYSSEKDKVIYPNPSTNHITLPEETSHVIIYSSDGNKMLSQDISKNSTLDISSLSRGIYIIKMTIKDSIETTKIIKN